MKSFSLSAGAIVFGKCSWGNFECVWALGKRKTQFTFSTEFLATLSTHIVLPPPLADIITAQLISKILI